MHRNFKKLLSILLVTVMVFGSAPLAEIIGDFSNVFDSWTLKARAETYGGYLGSGLQYLIDTYGELYIYNLDAPGYMTNWSSPSGSPWFLVRSSIKKVNVSVGVTNIGNYAFYDCSDLTTAIISDDVIDIGDSAFNCCNNLTYINLGNSVTNIGEKSFNYCSNLTKISIPNSLKSVGNSAFDNCFALTDIYFDGTEEEWDAIFIGDNNDHLLNATIHFKQVTTEPELKAEPITVTINVYATVDGSVAQFKEYGITISSSDENAPMPDETYLKTNNLGCVSFPIEIDEDDLYGLSSKTFVYDLTINSANGKKYDFSPKTQQVEITINNSNGNLSCVGLEDYYKFNGYSYKDFLFILTWDDGDDCCKVRPETLNLSLVSDRSDEKISFTISLDNRWRATVSVREVDDEFNYHEYSVDGLDYLEQIGYNIYLDESDDGYSIDAVASLPYCRVGFYTINGSSPANQYVVRNSTVTEPEAPTSEYYNFVGWYKDENCTDGKEWDFETDVVTQNTVLYAKWEPKPIKITLKTEYGILQGGENSKELTITIPACSAVGIKLSEEIYDSNYNHIGWVDEDGNVVTATTKLYEDTTLYAVWQKKPYYDSAISIRNNTGSKTINYGETLKLTATTTNMPDDSKIYWFVDGVKQGEGDVFEVSFDSGSKIVSAKLIGADGNVLKDVNGNEISDTETVTVKSGFFQKIISFFKNLFGIGRTVVQSICF